MVGFLLRVSEVILRRGCYKVRRGQRKLLLTVAPREMTFSGVAGELPQIQGKFSLSGPDAKMSHIGSVGEVHWACM